MGVGEEMEEGKRQEARQHPDAPCILLSCTLPSKHTCHLETKPRACPHFLEVDEKKMWTINT